MLEIQDHGPVREIRLARPPANAFNTSLVEAMQQALAEAEKVADAIVVSGRPGMFSAGLDVPELLGLDRNGMARFWQEYMRMLVQVARSPVPVAFALTGHAPAGGMVLALFGDYRVMSQGEYKTGLNEVQVGLVVPPPVYRALSRLIGPHKAERIAVAGEMMTAQRALEIGLVDELADGHDATLGRAIEWCRELLALPRPGMLATRAMARADLKRIFENSSELGIEHFIDGWFDETTQATLRALVARIGK